MSQGQKVKKFLIVTHIGSLLAHENDFCESASFPEIISTKLAKFSGSGKIVKNYLKKD